MSKKIEKQLGGRVAKLREAAGLTQAELAEEVGVATETISRLERGATIPSVSRLDDVASALGVDIVDLFERQSAVLERNEALAGLTADLKRRSAKDVQLVRELARTVFGHFGRRRGR